MADPAFKFWHDKLALRNEAVPLNRLRPFSTSFPIQHS